MIKKLLFEETLVIFLIGLVVAGVKRSNCMDYCVSSNFISDLPCGSRVKEEDY